MAHHAFVAQGEKEEVMERARGFAARHLALSGADNPDILTFSFDLFSVDDARKVAGAAYQSALHDQKLILVYAARLFHEAQNALLKVVEEPPAGVTIILGTPSLGILLPTLRSRLLPLPGAAEEGGGAEVPSDASSNAALEAAAHFLTLSDAERKKYAAALLERTKSDKAETANEARAAIAELLKGLMAHAHAQLQEGKTPAARAELASFLEDLSAFMPLLYERSVPLKLILEHTLLVIPKHTKKA